MKSITQLRRLIEKAGGKMEDDGEGSAVHIFQAVAPENKLWKCDDIHCLRIDWGIPATQCQQWNEGVYNDIAERVALGLRDMTEEEKQLYAEE